MKIQTGVVILLLLALTAPAVADPLPSARPEEVGMSSQRLERIGQTLRADVEKGRMPGAVVGIARKGKLIYYEAHGYLDKAAGIPMPKDAIFSIASMTKPMAGVAAMMMVEEGRLFLSDPVGQYLPPLGKMPVAVLKPDAPGQGPVETVPAKRISSAPPLLSESLHASLRLETGRRAPRERLPGFPGPHAPHLGPYLRGTRHYGGSQDVPGFLVGLFAHLYRGRIHREAGLPPAAVPSRNGVGLQPLH